MLLNISLTSISSACTCLNISICALYPKRLYCFYQKRQKHSGGGAMAGPRGRASYLTDEEKKNSPKITKELITRVFSYLKPYWRQLALVLVCIAVASVCSIFPSILTGNIIDVLTGKDMGGWFGAGLSALIRLIVLSL